MSSTIPVNFWSQGVRLAGRIHRNAPLTGPRQPAVIVTGSWLTVKEQMPALYATRFAALGYTALTFDFTGFGESEGQPRQTEIPAKKIADLAAAADFLSTLSSVEPGHVGLLAICASAQYGVAAIARGARIDAFASVAGWYHDTSTVGAFYGGEEGTARRLEIGLAAIDRLGRMGQVDIVPAYDRGNEAAAMWFDDDYYSNPARGAVGAWVNQMTTASWFYWLSFDGLSAASHVSIPTLFVHGDGCAFPDNARRVHERVAGPKRLVWMDGFQTAFYDRPDLVDAAVVAAHDHFGNAFR